MHYLGYNDAEIDEVIETLHRTGEMQRICGIPYVARRVCRCLLPCMSKRGRCSVISQFWRTGSHVTAGGTEMYCANAVAVQSALCVAPIWSLGTLVHVAVKEGKNRLNGGYDTMSELYRKRIEKDVVAYLKEHGPSTSAQIRTALNPQYCGNLYSSQVANILRSLEGRGIVQKEPPCHNTRVWGLCL